MDDHRAIEALIFGYAAAMDAGDLRAVAELFAHARYGGPDDDLAAHGADAVHATLVATVRLHGDGTPRTKHVTTNLVVDIDDEAGQATAGSYFQVLQATPALPLQTILAGRYRDRFERAEETWRFSERRIHTDLIGPVHEHLLVDPARLGLG